MSDTNEQREATEERQARTAYESSTYTETHTAAAPGINAVPDIVPAHYDGVRKTHWTTNSRGGWIEVTEAGVRRLLIGREGLAGGKLVDRLNEIVTDHDVAYAAPLAGYRSGLHEICGSRVLVTSSPKLIEPKEGDCPTLDKFVSTLLEDDGSDQRGYVDAWLKIAYESLRDGTVRTGPALALAGEANCGKSLLQNIITQIMGGRAAKPYRYMREGTQFNADLFKAEHLIIEDESASTDIRVRRAFGSYIKQFTSNEMQSCHGKNREALTLAPFWRLSISVNDENENLMVLPPIDDSLEDKIILLQAREAEKPPTTTDAQKKAFWATLMCELPAYIYRLVNTEIPAELQHGRFGLKVWQHPDLLESLSALSPERAMLRLIDEIIFTPLRHISSEKNGENGVKVRFASVQQWEGTAESLERELCDNDAGFNSLAYKARKLLSWPNACGTYLGRLAKQLPKRVTNARTKHERNWIIQPPG